MAHEREDLIDRTPTAVEYASNRALRKFVARLRRAADPPPRIVTIVQLSGVPSAPGNCISNVGSMIARDPTMRSLWGYQVLMNDAGGFRAAVHVVAVTTDNVYLDVTESADDETILFVPSTGALSPEQQQVAMQHAPSTRLGVVIGGTSAYVGAMLASEKEAAALGRLVADPRDLVMYQMRKAGAFEILSSGAFGRRV